MRLKIVPSNRFRRDLKLAIKRGADIALLNAVIETIAVGGHLDKRHRDHDLGGNYKGFRECHIQPDWLLIYRVMKNELELFLYRTGTHSDLFDE